MKPGFFKMATGALLAASAMTSSAQAETVNVEAELAALRAEIASLKAEQDQEWLNERRAEQVKSLIADVLADAETRSTLMNDGMYAGHDGKKYFLASADGSFKMNVSGQVQARYIWNSAENTGGDDNLSGFQMRRIKLKFNGHIGDPKIKYKLTLAADRDNGHDTQGDVYAEVASLHYGLADGVEVYGGRLKAPFARGELTSSSRQLTVERSSVTDTFTIGHVEGFGAKFEVSENIKANVMFNDGQNSGEYDAGIADWNSDNTDGAFTGRVDVKLAGDWGQMKDTTAWSGEDFAAFVGGAFHYEIGETGNAGTNDDFFSWTIDGSIESEGLGVMVAIYGNHTDNEVAADTDNYGFLAQASYNIDDTWEPFVRYELIDLDGAADEINIVTVGTNYYMKKHNAKFTVDAVFGLDPLAGVSDGAGLRADAAGEDGQVALRGQFQLLF